MKKLLCACVALLMCATMAACSSNDTGTDASTTTESKIKIGVIQLAEHPALDSAYQGFMDALTEAGYTEDKVDFDYQNASGDLSNCTTIAEKLVNDGNDLIYAIATPAAQSVANKTTTIPVVVSAVTDPADSGLVASNEKPGNNITGASDLTPVKEQIELLQQILPDAKKIAIMYCSSEDNSIFQANIAKDAATAANLEYVEATVSDTSMIQQVTESLIGKVDAIYIPTDNMLAEGMTSVTSIANANNLPCIVGEGGMIINGGLATYGIDYYELGRLAGQQAIDILEGKSVPADMPIAYLPAEQCALTVNTTAASQLGITIPQELLDKAEIVE